MFIGLVFIKVHMPQTEGKQTISLFPNGAITMPDWIHQS